MAGIVLWPSAGCPCWSESGIPKTQEVSASDALVRGVNYPMRGPYPGELRRRVIGFVEAGGSRREAAEQFDIGVSSAIRRMQRFTTGLANRCCAAEALRHWRSTPSRSLRSAASSRTSHWMRSSWHCTSVEFLEAGALPIFPSPPSG
jgi:hypothetical protein